MNQNNPNNINNDYLSTNANALKKFCDYIDNIIVMNGNITENNSYTFMDHQNAYFFVYNTKDKSTLDSLYNTFIDKIRNNINLSDIEKNRSLGRVNNIFVYHLRYSGTTRITGL